MRPKLTQRQVRSLFHYEPETGVLTCKVRRGTSKVGRVVGYINNYGYRGLKIHGQRYQASHVIFLWMTGKWPEAEMDHKNLVRDDDRWENLREATRSENCMNRGTSSVKNTIGFRGVRKVSKTRFAAVIGIGQNEHYVGSFLTAELAALAYDVAAKKLHGAYARLN